jgi:hypothetical protein
MKMTRIHFVALAAATALTLAACGGDSATTTTQPTGGTVVKSFAGTYSCSYSGGDAGTFTAVLPTDSGTFSTCSGRSTVVGNTFACTGSITPTGAISTAFTSNGAQASGTATDTGASGNWASGAIGGPFTCTRGK